MRTKTFDTIRHIVGQLGFRDPSAIQRGDSFRSLDIPAIVRADIEEEIATEFNVTPRNLDALTFGEIADAIDGLRAAA